VPLGVILGVEFVFGVRLSVSPLIRLKIDDLLPRGEQMSCNEAAFYRTMRTRWSKNKKP